MSNLKRILFLLKKSSAAIVVALVFAAISVILAQYVNVVVGETIDCMIGKGNVDTAGVKKGIIIIGVCILISAVFQWVMNLILNKVAFTMVRDLRKAAFEKLQRVPVSYADRTQPGDTISRLVNDIEQVSDGLIMGFAKLFTGVVTIGATLVFMLTLNWKIALVVILVTPLTLFVARFIASNTFKYFKLQTEANGALSSIIEESVSGISVIKAFSKEEDRIKDFDEKNKRLQETGLKAVFFSSTVNPTTRLINGIVYAALGVLGAFSVMSGGMTVGLLSSFLAYANQFTKPFNEISGVVAEFQSALASAGRVFELLDSEEVTEREGAVTEFDADGNVKLCDVAFSYDPEVELIKDFDLDVKSGQRIAVVGPTGCGKTTFINLLMRFYDVNSGDILLNREKHSVYDMTRSALRENYGMVLQETWLREGTIRDNIAMGKPDATDEEIINAAKLAYAHGFITRFPDEYDTVIADDGGNLSQGQKQLICIARLMLALPPMLILDEATSSIDTRTEIKVQKAFAELMKGRTSFVVAHRLSTISESDCIIVMDNGRIVEKGTHEELINRKGFYHDLYYSQFE